MSCSFNKILVTSPDASNCILSDFLEKETVEQLPLVSKVMRMACARARNTRLIQQLTLRDRASITWSHLEAREICNGRPLDTALAEVMEEFRQIPNVDMTHGPMQECVQEIYDAYSAEDPSSRNMNLGERLLVCIHGANTMAHQYASCWATYNLASMNLMLMLNGDVEVNDEDRRAEQEHVEGHNEQVNALRHACAAHVREFLARESLAWRAQAVLSQPRDPRDAPITLPQFLPQLHRVEEESFNLTRAQRDSLDAEMRRNQKDPAHYSRENFLARERIGVECTYAECNELRRMWPIVRPEVPDAPPIGAPLSQIRAALPRFQGERLGLNCEVIPRDIIRFPNLRRISITGNEQYRLASLPSAFGELVHLEEIEFSGCSFREIPPVLERLPALRHLHIRDNQHPIREFPLWLDEKLNRGYDRGLNLFLRNEFDVQPQRLSALFHYRVNATANEWDSPYAGLPHDTFTAIPFNRWFQENIAIPNIVICAVHGIETWWRSDFSAIYQQGWIEMTRALILPLLPFVLYCMTAYVSLCLTMSLVLLPFIINPLLYYLVEPLWESIRDELGYDPLVRRPLPPLPVLPARA